MKKAIVIGGTSGIGKGLALELLANNYKVVVTGIEKNVSELFPDLETDNLEVKYLDCIHESAHEVLAEIVNSLGGLDLLVFSAGIGNLNKDLGFKVENNANKLNVLAFTEIVDWGYRFFVKQGYGHLVAVSSFSGLFGSRVAPAYHAAKAYQINYMEALRQKAHRSGLPIYITDVRPGYVETPMTEGKKMIWAVNADRAGRQIFRLIKRKSSFGYVSRRWYFVGVVVKFLPGWIRSRL